MPFYSITTSGGLVEAATFAALPATGATGTLYVVTATNTLYRWSGSAYTEVSASPAEVVEAANLAAFPATGATGKIYVALDTGKTYRWGGSAYAEISAGDWATITGKPSTFSPSAHAASHGTGGADAVTLAATQVTSTLGTASLQGDISQLSGIVSTLGTAATYDAPGAGDNAAVGNVVLGSDTRLTNARAPTSHVHGNVTNAGAIGTTSGLPIVTGASGVLQAGSFGTAAGSVCQGNDARLSDSRAPTGHGHNATDVNVSDLGTNFFNTDDQLPYVLQSIDAGLSGRAAAVHTHSAGDITSGTLSDSRLSIGARSAVESFIHPFLFGGL